MNTYVRTYARYDDSPQYGVADSPHCAFLDPCFYDNCEDGDDGEDETATPTKNKITLRTYRTFFNDTMRREG